MRLALLVALLIAGCGRPGDSPVPASATPAGCGACHATPEDAPPDLHGGLGCETCHLGDSVAKTAEVAHLGLELEPGALDTVDRTCGQAGCHAREAARVATSMMATGVGMVAVDRWVFGELDLPNGTQSIRDVVGAAQPTAGEDHLRRLCAGCHLGTRRANRDDAVRGAGSGCSACHSASRTPGGAHPTIDGVVPDERCLGCHSRSARISLAFQGLAEVHPGAECEAPRQLFDGRPGCEVTPDVHRVAGMACTDCHLHTELMGDGQRHAHQEQAVEISCVSCHGPASAANEATWAEVDDPITATLLARRGQSRELTEAVRRGQRGTPLWNLRPGAERAEGSSWTLSRKADGKAMPVPPTPPDANHQLAGHQRLTCSACHAAWAPMCPECHTRFDPGGEQWDFGAGEVRPGRWVEGPAPFGWAEPGLGVSPDDTIVPVVPGMHATIDRGAAGSVTQRLFARAAPHTTSKTGRECSSCHHQRTDPLAWSPKQPGQGTRVGLRSMDAAAWARVRGVAACLPCHKAAADPIYRDFEGSKAGPKGACKR